MKPTLQLSFDSLEAMRRFLEKIIPVVDDGSLKESTIQTLKSGLEYKEQQEPAPVTTPLPGSTPTVAAVQPAPAPAPMPTPQPVQTELQGALQAAAPAPVQPVATAAVVPTTEPVYTADDLSRAACAIMEPDGGAALRQLLAQYGVVSVGALQPSQYGAFANALRAMGAQI